MEIKGLKFFKILLKSSHETLGIEQFICVAMCSERAIGLTKMQAEKNGWEDYDVDQVICLGDLDILDLQYFGECEVAKCQS